MNNKTIHSDGKRGISNKFNKATQAVCMRNVVQVTALLEYLKIIYAILYLLVQYSNCILNVKLPIPGII